MCMISEFIFVDVDDFKIRFLISFSFCAFFFRFSFFRRFHFFFFHFFFSIFVSSRFFFHQIRFVSLIIARLICIRSFLFSFRRAIRSFEDERC